MPRNRQRVRLEDGLRLDLNRLLRRGFIRHGALTEPAGIVWTSNYWGEVASGLIWADMRDSSESWLRIKIGSHDQLIDLDPVGRNFGGWQWYFICPLTNRRVSTLWRPPGARDFACRQKWGRQVAYASQFLSRLDRAHRGKDRINRRLCSVGGLDPEEWDLPPKPKWMRWNTYDRAVEKFDHYESVLDEGTLALMTKLMERA